MKLFGFLDFTVTDAIDIALFAVFLYFLYKLVRGTVAVNIFIGIVVIYTVWQITRALDMELMSSIFGGFIGVGFFALIVVFQEELRRLLLMLGDTSTLSGRKNIINFFKGKNNREITDVEEIVEACKTLSSKKDGGLIIIEKNSSLDATKRTGDKMEIDLEKSILVSLFDKNSPFHDGAIVVKGNTIVATRAILPLSKNNKIPLKYGLRHRSAIGITENTDAIALVVSEETGKLSYIKNGKFAPYRGYDKLISAIKKDLTANRYF